MIQVKICGITRLEDAMAAIGAGANLLGFVFAPSPRRIEPADAGRIREHLPDGVERVGVFVNEDPARILEIARTAGLTMVQLHGDEAAEAESVLAGAGLAVMKAIRVADLAHAVAAAGAWKTPYLLIEPRVEGKVGGTGKTLDADLAAALIAALPGRRVFLAGGLGPDNVRSLVDTTRPWGVDASSRLEVSPGKKDPVLIKRFLEATRS